MKPQRPLFPFDVCWSHVSNLARILGHFYLKLNSNPESAYLWKFPRHPSKKLAKLVNYLRAGSLFLHLGATTLITEETTHSATLSRSGWVRAKF